MMPDSWLWCLGQSDGLVFAEPGSVRRGGKSLKAGGLRLRKLASRLLTHVAQQIGFCVCLCTPNTAISAEGAF